MIKLYHAPRARSVRPLWLLEEMGVPYETVSLKLGEKPPELVEINPGATIPLMIDGDVVLFESITMLEYIAETYGPTPLALSSDHPHYWDYRQMLMWGEATLASPLNFVVGTVFRAPEDQRANYTIDLVRETFAKRMGVVEKQLARAPYMAGEEFTLADISVSYSISLAKDVEAFDLRHTVSDAVRDYLRRLSERPAFQRMVKVR
jgi:glutathione S-transferase